MVDAALREYSCVLALTCFFELDQRFEVGLATEGCPCANAKFTELVGLHFPG